ncbi:MAG: acetyl-CoA carboxylase carboxyl transferase subunit beta [Dehalococcoidia bacterium]|nr:acetyl-CoA carboxylase carboxyl transferase subunit beta [Dehalococcoidia bacterium]
MRDFFSWIVGQRKGKEERGGLALLENCLYCDMELSSSEFYQRYRLCPGCGFYYVLPAWERIDLLADEGSFIETNYSLASLDPLSFTGESSYKKRVFDAQKRTGLPEAVVTGVCQIEGTLTVIVVLDFGFLGGSMGCVVGEKVALAFEHALKKRLPLVAVVSSGGARVQEGVLSLMQMAKTAAAAKQLHAAGLPFISVLSNPTTGEVYASFANLADIIIAEPNALIGFAPLRVVEQTEGRTLPQDAHTAESHLKHGMIDCVVERTGLRELLAILLDLLSSQYRLTLRRRFGPYPPIVPHRESVWQSVQLARHVERPTSLDYIGRITSSFVELHGDRCYGDDGAVVCGLGEIGGEAVVIIAQERGHDGDERNRGRAYPEGFRKAQRAMNLAAKFMLPLITFIDTPGAYPGLDAEERGVGSAIAQCLALMSDLPTPIISVIIGEGGSEGALAFGVADRILMMENAIFSVMPPERAAVLLYRDAKRAKEVAPALRLTAEDCIKLGVVDVLVTEPKGGAHLDPDEAARQLKKFLLSELVQVQGASPGRLVKARYDKFRKMGRYSSRISVAISKERAEIQGYLSERLEELKEYLPSRAEEVPAPKEEKEI